MFIWLTGLVVFVVFFGLYLWKEGWCGLTFGVPIMLGVLGLGVAIVASLIIGACVPQTAVSEVSRSELQLIALKDNMAIDGYHGRNMRVVDILTKNCSILIYMKQKVKV